MIKKKRWRLCEGDREKENILIRELGVNPIVAKLMVNRHIDVDEGRQFLQGTLSDLLDPFTLKDMDVAVSLVQETIESHKPIVIYGDYDVDGITATSVLYRFLKKLGADVTYYNTRTSKRRVWPQFRGFRAPYRTGNSFSDYRRLRY